MGERSGFEYSDGAASPVEVLIVAGDAANRELIAGAAMIVGLRVVSGPASARLADGAIDIVVADIRGCDDDSSERLLAEVEQAAKAAPLRVIVAMENAQIDLAAAILFGPHVKHLCAPTIVDFATALSAARVAPDRRARDSGREAERLRRLNAEIARIADALSQIAREGRGSGGDDAPGLVRDARPAFGAGPAAALPAVDPAGCHGAPAASVTAAEVRATIRARRMRAQYFDADLFADPAWDMLLDLFAAGLEGARVSVSSLCIAAAVPGTTALRWISTMTEGGLLVREADPYDRRRAYVALSPDAAAAMTAYFGALKRQSLPGA